LRVYPSLTQQEEFEALRGAGYTGALNDMQYAYLGARGQAGGSLPDRFKDWNKGFSPVFRPDDAGVWYDPSDLSTVFQDVAGTVPADVGDDVGLILDKSGGGNHAFQTDDLLKPTLMQDSNGNNYLYFFSGTNLVTNAIDLTSSDEVTIFSAWEKEVDTNTRAVYEFSAAADSTSNHGTFALLSPRNNLASDAQSIVSGEGFRSVLNVSNVNVSTKYTTTQQMKISTDLHEIRVNGVLDGSASDDLGGGTVGNHVLYIGSRAGSSLVFQGAIYGLCIVNRLLEGSELVEAERLMGQSVRVDI